jgi:hypothetical protein
VPIRPEYYKVLFPEIGPPPQELKDFFFEYYGEDDIGRGILVDKVDILEIPLTLNNVMSGAKPPQSFTYADKLIWLSLKRRKKRSWQKKVKDIPWLKMKSVQ